MRSRRRCIRGCENCREILDRRVPVFPGVTFTQPLKRQPSKRLTASEKTMNNCPHCHRRLISHISPRCNWCGKEIEDAAYQANADTERAAFFAQQAIHDAQSLVRTEAMLTTGLDPFGPGPLFGILAGQRRPSVLSRPSRRQMAAQEAALAAIQLEAQNNAPPQPTFGSALTPPPPAPAPAPAADQAALDAAFEAAQQAQRAAAQRHADPVASDSRIITAREPAGQLREAEQRPWYAAPAELNRNNQTPRPQEASSDDLPGPQETAPEHTQNRFQTIEW